MTEFNERLIKVLDEELVPTENHYLSGRLGFIVTHYDSTTYKITITGKENPLLTVKRLNHLKKHLKVDPFKGMDIAVYVDEVTELRDRNLWITHLQIFVAEKEKK